MYHKKILNMIILSIIFIVNNSSPDHLTDFYNYYYDSELKLFADKGIFLSQEVIDIYIYDGNRRMRFQKAT